MFIIQKLEKIFKSILQKEIKINLNNKQFKKGRFILYNTNNYYLDLTIKKSDGVMKKMEIPIPFGVECWEEDKLIYLDYRLKTLASMNEELYTILKKMKRDGNNKFYDKILEIEIVN